jgi:hypothetical protein
MSDTHTEIPYIDPKVQYVGVSKLRTLNATNLNELDKTLVIQDNDRPLAVVLSYEQFMAMQRERESILTTLSMFFDDEQRDGLLAGIKDVLNDRTKPLSAIRESLKKQKG